MNVIKLQSECVVYQNITYSINDAFVKFLKILTFRKQKKIFIYLHFIRNARLKSIRSFE